MTITSFEDLDCWKESTTLATHIYRLTSEGTIAKDYGLRDQIRRAAISVPSNIAEGKERETVAEFVRFLYIAKGSAGELRTQLFIAREIGYFSDEQFMVMKEKLERISGMIGNLIKALRKPATC